MTVRFAAQDVAPARRSPVSARRRWGGDVRPLPGPHALATIARAAGRAVTTRVSSTGLAGDLLRYAPIEGLEDRTLLSVSTNSQGWTVVTPSSDTRTIYVSTGGNDANDGLSPATPIATLAKAKTLVRSGFPDWVLLRRGDVFNGQRLSQWNFSGRSSTEPFVVGAYTDPNAPSTARPQLNTGIQTGMSFGSVGASHLYVMGVAFEAHNRDYRAPTSSFDTTFLTDAQGGTYGINGTGPISDMLVEDCSFQYYRTNLVFQGGTLGKPSDIRIRRDVVADAWAVNVDGFGNAMGSDTASIGLYADGVTNLSVDGSTFEHNGWVDNDALGARRNLYSHNLYLNTGNTNVSVTNNIIADAASHGLQMRAGGLVSGNVFLRNPIAMSYGLVNGAVKAGGVSGEISNNVVIGSNAIFDSPRGWGIEIANLKSIANGGGTVIKNNVFANDNQNNSYAIKLDQPNTTVPDVGINDLRIEGNIVYSWWKGLYVHPSYGTSSRPLTGLVVRGNDYQRLTGTGSFIDLNAPYSAADQNWSYNRYDGTVAETSTNKWFKISGVQKTFAEWQSIVEPTAVKATAIFPDPGRTTGGYNATIGGTNSTDAFVAQAMRQSRQFWRPKYTTAPVIDYIRAGYTGGMIDLTGPTASASASNVTVGGGAGQTFKVLWSDDNKLNLSSLGDGDVRVTGPNGYSVAATFVASTGPSNGSRRTVTYRVAAPTGSWSAADNGLYTITVEPGQVTDVTGKAATADPIGSFSVAITTGVPTAVATATAITTDTAAATVNVTYSGVTTSVATSVLPQNAGFETPNVGGGYVGNPTGAGWNFVGTSGLSGDSNAFTSGNPTAPQGVQVAYLQATGSFDQSISGWQAGTYTLSFKAALRGNNGPQQHDFQVLVDGVVQGTFSPTSTAYAAFTTAPFFASAGTHTVQFLGLNSAGGDNTSFIDDVQIVGMTQPARQKISIASIDTGDIQLVGANLVFTPSNFSSPPSDTEDLTAMYVVAAPAEGWSSLGVDSLNVVVQPSQVATTTGATVPSDVVGTVSLAIDAPVVTAVVASDIPSNSFASQTFTVSYVDGAPGAALPASVDSSDIRVTGPGGYNQAATLIAVSGAGTAASPLVATYTVSAPALGWGSSTNGTYWITLQPNQVIDADGNAAAAGPIDSFRVAVDTTAPLAWAALANITAPVTATRQIGVSYYDISGINGSTLDSADIRVTGPNGFNQLLTKSFSNNGTTAAYAEYALPAPNGKWQSVNNGTYSITLEAGAVADAKGNVSSAAKTLATFTVALETTPPVATPDPISPSYRTTAVTSIPVTFSESVTGFDKSDVVLTRNGSVVSLTSAVTVTAGVDAAHYSVDGLTALTGSLGNYVLTVRAAGSGISDAAGNLMAVDGSTSWTVGIPQPTAQVNDGSAQRSRVTSLTVTFDRSVFFDAGAFTLNGHYGAGAGTNVLASNPLGDGKTWVLTFDGATVNQGSLADGVYDLVVAATMTHPTATPSAVMAGDYTFTFHCLYGDYNGDRVVGGIDYFQFARAYGQPTIDAATQATFDYDQNGTIGGSDYFQFARRYGKPALVD